VTIDDLAPAWRRRAEPDFGAQPAPELAAIRARARQLDVTVRRRDRIETLVALSLLPIFGTFAARADGVLVRAGAAIVAISCLWIPLVLRRARRRALDHRQPGAAFLRLELDFVLRQRRLLLTVPWWYLGPLGIGVILFFAGASPSPWLTAVYAAVVVAFYFALYRLNRRAVESNLEPWAHELRLWIAFGGEDEGADDESDAGGDAPG
jgi:hypothetical protein